MKHPAWVRVFAVAACVLLPTIGRAQSTSQAVPVPASAADTAPVCYGFSFGAWTPALDRAAAGHDPAARGGPGAPDGRGWAVSDSGGSTASSLILFPAWWPAGVRVSIPNGPPRVGQSATGKAVALVADGRRRPPSATIVVHGVSCGRAEDSRDRDGR